MDVFAEFASTLAGDGEEECLNQLLEYLSTKRRKAAGKLRDAIAKQRETVDRRLERYSCLVQEELSGSKDDPLIRQQWQSMALVAASQLSDELSAWPRLTVANMHSFRLKVKELRYILQLVDQSNMVEMFSRPCTRGSGSRTPDARYYIRSGQLR